MHSPLSTPLATTSSKRAAASLEPHDRLLLMMHTEGLHPQGVTQRSASTLPTPIVPSDRAEIPRFPELQFCQGPLLPSWAHPVLDLSSGAGWALLIASHPCTEGSEELYQSAPSAVLAHRPANSPVDWGSVPIQPTSYERWKPVLACINARHSSVPFYDLPRSCRRMRDTGGSRMDHLAPSVALVHYSALDDWSATPFQLRTMGTCLRPRPRHGSVPVR